jgi:hypothetical protein
MARIPECLIVQIKVSIGFWDAIKLRIAGRRFKEYMIEKMEITVDKAKENIDERM